MTVQQLIKWLSALSALALLALLVAAIAAGLGHPSQTTATVATPNITIAGPGAPVAVGSSFNVQVSVDSEFTLFNGYQVEIDVPAGLSFMSGTHDAMDTFPSCFGWATGPVAGPTWQYAGCAHSDPDTAFTGLVGTVTLRCDSVGTFPVNLVDADEDPDTGSMLWDANDPLATNTTPDGEQTVTCQTGPADTPTPTATSTPTNTSTPTVTPEATATPAPAVGGIAELPAPAGASDGESGAATEERGQSAGAYAALAAGVGAAAASTTLGAWYVRRRRLR